MQTLQENKQKKKIVKSLIWHKQKVKSHVIINYSEKVMKRAFTPKHKFLFAHLPFYACASFIFIAYTTVFTDEKWKFLLFASNVIYEDDLEHEKRSGRNSIDFFIRSHAHVPLLLPLLIFLLNHFSLYTFNNKIFRCVCIQPVYLFFFISSTFFYLSYQPFVVVVSSFIEIHDKMKTNEL